MKCENITTLENFCRTCMNGDKENEGDKSKVISIFDKPEIMECEDITIMELLSLTTPQLNIDSGDMLPKTLCENCFIKLIEVYKFQKMCIRVEHKLRQMIEEFPAEFQANEDQLKDNLIISVENISVSQPSNDIIKVNGDDPIIDEDVPDLCYETVIDDSESVKYETDSNEWQGTSDSDDFDDTGSEWEDLCHKEKRKKCSKDVVKKAKKVIDDSEHIKYETDDNQSQDENDSDESDDTDSEWEDLSHKEKRKKCSKDVVKEVKEEMQSLFEHKEDEKTAKVMEVLKIDSNLSDVKHDEKKKFSCEKCGKFVKTHKGLLQHKKIHLRNIDGDEPASVTIEENKTDLSKETACDEHGSRLAIYKRIHSTNVNESQRNTPVKMKHECEICKKGFKRPYALRIHLRAHTGEHPYLCSECGKTFTTGHSLKQHALRHGTDRTYACADCPKKFTCSSDLSSHKIIHNKIKSHVCDICDAAFVMPCLLRKHKMYHTGEKNHKCDYCDMRFVLNFHRQRHMRTHTGEKPYKCKYCERAFAQSNDLMKHLRVHLGDNVYKCDLCPKSFRLHMDLRAHFNTHKNDDEDTKVRNLQALKDEELKLQMKFDVVNST